MCREQMNYPATPKQFIESYAFTDIKREYTNGSLLIPVFRVEQMIEHYFRTDKGEDDRNGCE